MPNANESLLEGIFMPFYVRRVYEIKTIQKKFVHYTSARAALSILQHKELWMRSTTCMNDFREVEYGESLFSRLCQTEQYTKFCKAFSSKMQPVFEKAMADAIGSFAEWKGSTYICSLSEHEDEEDKMGRLSMWRGYGKDTGVAIVFKSDIFTSDFHAFPIYTSPVEYMTPIKFDAAVDSIIDNVQQNQNFLDVVPEDELRQMIIAVVHFASVSIKHPGFKEEKEWRIIADLNQPGRLRRDILDVNGVPQIILKIPLSSAGGDDSHGFSINRNLEHIIIGPTPYPDVIYEALVSELEQCGVTDAANKVVKSDIPFRG